MAMLSDQDLFDAITLAALKASDVDIGAHRHAIWLACTTLMADVLRQTDPFTRERLLHGLVAELRGSIARLDQLLRPSADNPSPYPKLN
jgi:hypothetical protein